MSGTSTRSRLACALGAAVGLLVAGLAAQTAPADIEEVLARAAERVEEYVARAQRIVVVERTMIQYVRSDLTPEGFARVLESDLRVESDAADDGDGSSEPKVVRELKRVNGHPPRKKDDHDCLDPNPISPEPLTFLLPAQREKYAFTWAGPAKGKDKKMVMVDFRELGSGKPEVTERSDRGDGCYSIELPGRGRGRVWLDASTFEVLRIDQRINAQVDIRVPDRKNHRFGFPDVQVIERLDMSIRYKPFSFSDPEEVVLLPESIDTLMVVRGMQSYRMRQTFSNYRRFVTGGRLIK
jgi:hypothetical protein